MEEIKNPSLSFLLVEDEDDHANILTYYIEFFGKQRRAVYEVYRAGSVGEAINALKVFQFGCILLDLNLPDSQGISTVERVAGAARNTPIIVLTAHSVKSWDLGVEAINAGAEDFLDKTDMDDTSLRRIIEHAITRFSKRSGDINIPISDITNMQQACCKLDEATNNIKDTMARLTTYNAKPTQSAPPTKPADSAETT